MPSPAHDDAGHLQENQTNVATVERKRWLKSGWPHHGDRPFVHGEFYD